MFNLLKLFNRNKHIAFSVGGIGVIKLITTSISGNHFTYTAVFDGFEIRFDYNDYFVNQIGDLRLLIDDVIIKYERHNITISKMKPEKYIRSCFRRLLQYLKQLEINSVKTILKTFQYDIFKNSHDFRISEITKNDNVTMYQVLVTVNDNAPYHSKFNSLHNHTGSVNVIDFDGIPFDDFSDTSFRSLTLMNFTSHSIIYNKKIESYPSQYVAYTTSKSGNNSFYNKDYDTGLYYAILSSNKEKNLSTDISIVVSWIVNFTEQSVKFSALIYENNILIENIEPAMESRFIDKNIDKEYYSNLFEILFEKLILTYFPTQELADFLHITDFNGRLTEEQYNVFSMYFL